MQNKFKRSMNTAAMGGGIVEISAAPILALSPNWLLQAKPSTCFQEITGGAATTPSAVDGVVGTLRNLGSNGGNVVAPTTTTRPLLKVVNNKYSWLHDGVDDRFEMDVNFTVTSNFTAIAAFTRIGGASIQAIARSVSGEYICDWYNDDRIYDYTSGVLPAVRPLNNTTGNVVLTVVRNGTTTRIRVNGVQIDSQSSTTPPSAIKTIARASSAAQGHYQGVGFWSSELTGSNLTTAESWFGSLNGAPV
jgi:hypothetical protein